MCDTTISVWFVCRLCRGSFGQVDAFIEHKKQKHFTQFQNTTCIVFEESENGPGCPVISSNGDIQIAEEIYEPPTQIEVNNEDAVIPFSSEIIDEPNLDLVEVMSELNTYEREINPGNENNLYGLKQPEKNPYVLLKRLTSDEIQRASIPKHRHFKHLTFKQKNLKNSSKPRYYNFDFDSNITDHNELQKPTEHQLNPTLEHDLQFECKLCSKQLESAVQLKIHVGICALYHEDRNRFCVTCNRKFCNIAMLKRHRLRFHGTEVEKLSLYKFKCHICPNRYQEAVQLRLHLQSHKKKKQKKVSTSKSKRLKCSYPNCTVDFRCNATLLVHIDSVHLGLRPFSCHFPNCNKAFTLRKNLDRHFLIHSGERPFKCTANNCNESFISSTKRSIHRLRVHYNFPLQPVITGNGDHQLADELGKPPIKVEVNDDDPFISFGSEIIDEPNLDLVEPQSKPITFESEINPVTENNFFGLKQPEQNPYVLLKRLAFEEIQSACVPQHHSTLLKCEQKNLAKRSEPHFSSDILSETIDHGEVERCTEKQPIANIIISKELDPQFECNLCSKQLESAVQLRIHVGICALYHEDRKRFCVTCNRKFYDTHSLKLHRLRFHGTEEEKLSLLKFKCHVCPKQYREARDLGLHLATHKQKKQKKVKSSKSKPFKCPHPNCGKEFPINWVLQRHISTVHLGVRPFSCSFPKCNNSFSQRHNLKRHLLTHTGERPFKCTVDNCGKTFRTSRHRTLHHRGVHGSL